MAGYMPEVSTGRGRGHVGVTPSGRFSPLSSIVIFTVALFSAVIILATFYSAYEDALSRTRTPLGHNLEPTPWHPFPHDKARPSAYAAFRCTSYLSCPPPLLLLAGASPKGGSRKCPSYFAAILRDLAPWRRAGVSAALLDAARQRASMRLTVTGGGRRLHVDMYYACVQSRALFTVWGLLQLMRRYPGRVPDVDLMFDCMDRPAINRTEYGDAAVGEQPPPPLFRYCTTKNHFDIPFPDWSFWGWPETNIEPWNQEFRSIKRGAKAKKWRDRAPTAYWKGNPNVASPLRIALLGCNDTNMWHAEIMRQNWDDEAKSGFQSSKLSSQCTHRYKIYAEGFAWSVSLKYIMSCGSLALIIDPQYQDFFSRGLVPKLNFWPVDATNLCESIKLGVEWGNSHPSHAERMGKRGQKLMQELDMDMVYDYMFHLLVEYSKLMDFSPAPPPTAQEVCAQSLLCIADKKQRRFMEESVASPSLTEPCILPPDGGN